ncbi:histidine triad nucleotide-binding protein [Methylolobus aquaticus]
MSECLFCKMVAGEIAPDIVYETSEVLAFRDIHPQAPVHILVIPKRHIATLDDLPDDQPALAAELLAAARRVAAQSGVAESGYRTVINCRSDAGQAVYHLHLHVLGGRRLHWPPG